MFLSKVFLSKLLTKKIFLVDGIGALLSAVLLGVVLVKLAPYFGMPIVILHKLAIAACGFACYSFACYLLVRNSWKPFISVIMVINFLYCVVTSYLLFVFYDSLTILGFTYFSLEIIVILTITFFEYRALRS
jgi:hypothetical protein